MAVTKSKQTKSTLKAPKVKVILGGQAGKAQKALKGRGAQLKAQMKKLGI